MIPISDIPNSDLEEREDIAELANEARAFLAHENWCKGIKAGYFDRGFSKVAVFLFEVELNSTADSKVWVVVGDVPPAYIDYELCPNGAAALDGYVAEMLAWEQAARSGSSTEELIPVVRRGSFVPLEPTIQVADMVRGRMNFIKRELLSLWPDELASGPLEGESHDRP